MSKTATKTRKSGKFLTGLIAFLLGFLFAIIVEVGVIVGAGFYIANSNIDDVFGMFGQQNDDGKGNQLIDTTGDIKTVMDLINEITAISTNWNDMAIGEIITLSPALEAALQDLYADAQNYGIYIDHDELMSQTVDSLAEYFSQTVLMSIRPYELITSFGEDGQSSIFEENAFLQTILLGSEASAVSNGSDEYIVYYDEYVLTDEGYARYEMDGQLSGDYPSGLDPEAWLQPTKGMVDGDYIYRQYFYYDASADRYTVTTEQEDGTFAYNVPDAANQYPEEYGSAPVRYTGNYITDEDGQLEYLTDSEGNSLAVTIGTFYDSTIASRTFYYVDAAELFGDMLAEDSQILNEMFDGVTLGDIIDERIDVDANVDGLEVSTVLNVAPDNRTLVYIAYGLTNVTAAPAGSDYAYTGTYTYTDEQGILRAGQAQVYVTEDIVDRVVGEDGEEIASSKVGDIGGLIEDIQISAVIDISVDNEIMAYIGYGLTDIVENDGVYTATYHAEDGSTQPCTITVGENGIITGVELADGQIVPASTVDVLNDRVSEMTSTLTIGEITSYEGGNKILDLIKDSTIDGIADTVDDLTVQNVYSDAIYGIGEGEEEWTAATEDNFDSAYLYYTKTAGGDYVLVNSDNDDVSDDGRLESFDGGEYYTRGAAVGVWKLLLYTDGHEVSYKLNDLDAMVEAAVNNIGTATMNDLYEAGVLNNAPSENKVPVAVYEDGMQPGDEETIVEIGGIEYVMRPIAHCSVNDLLYAVDVMAGLLPQGN